MFSKVGSINYVWLEFAETLKKALTLALPLDIISPQCLYAGAFKVCGLKDDVFNVLSAP